MKVLVHSKTLMKTTWCHHGIDYTRLDHGAKVLPHFFRACVPPPQTLTLKNDNILYFMNRWINTVWFDLCVSIFDPRCFICIYFTMTVWMHVCRPLCLSMLSLVILSLTLQWLVGNSIGQSSSQHPMVIYRKGSKCLPGSLDTLNNLPQRTAMCNFSNFCHLTFALCWLAITRDV